MRTKRTSNGHIVIPSKVRKQAGLRVGDDLDMMVEEDDPNVLILRRGTRLLPSSARRARLEQWLESQGLILYVVADNPIGESVYYPDCKKWGVRSPEHRLPRSEALDYYDGEE